MKHHKTFIRFVRAGLLACLLGSLLGACTSRPSPVGEWPSTVISYDKMRVITPLSIMLYTKMNDDMPRGRGAWKLWVDEQGKVRNVSQVQSSGHPNFDEAVTQGVWSVRFAPWLVDGKSQAVTVAMPVSMR